MPDREIVIRLVLPRSPRVRWLFGVFTAVLTMGAVAYATVLNTFSTGDGLSSSKINANFRDLDTRMTAIEKHKYIDLTMTSGDLSLTPGSSYSAISDASLVVSQNHSTLAGVTMATNGGVNSFGVTFPTSTPGQVARACVYFSVQLAPQASVATNVSAFAQFQIAQTGADSSTIIHVGTAHAVVSAGKEYNAANGVSAFHAISLCSHFTFDTPGAQTLRLLQKVSVTGASSAVIAGTSTDTDVHWDVEFL